MCIMIRMKLLNFIWKNINWYLLVKYGIELKLNDLVWMIACRTRRNDSSQNCKTKYKLIRN